MAIISVDGYAFSSTFKLRELMPMFSALGGETRLKDRLVVVLEEGKRYVLAYDFGAVVFIGVDAEVQKKVVADVVHRVGEEPHPPMTEAFVIDVEAGRAVEVRFDRVVVPAIDIDIVDIVGLVVAQSAAMDYYEQDVFEIETETDRIAEGLRLRGKIPGRVRQLIQFIGLCIATRNDIISTLALFDKPDVTWEKEALDKLWNDLHRMLEIDDRYRALEAKLRMFQDNLTVLVDLTRQRASILLEIAVVVLILAETFVALLQLTRG
jgi:uncharacterized Rmd1/YagE family protein